jgi:hypothetical protein
MVASTALRKDSHALGFHRGSTAAQIIWSVLRVPCLAWLHDAGMRRRLYCIELLSGRARFRCAWLDAVRNEVTRRAGGMRISYVGICRRATPFPGAGHLNFRVLAASGV